VLGGVLRLAIRLADRLPPQKQAWLQASFPSSDRPSLEAPFSIPVRRSLDMLERLSQRYSGLYRCIAQYPRNDYYLSFQLNILPVDKKLVGTPAMPFSEFHLIMGQRPDVKGDPIRARFYEGRAQLHDRCLFLLGESEGRLASLIFNETDGDPATTLIGVLTATTFNTQFPYSSVVVAQRIDSEHNELMEFGQLTRDEAEETCPNFSAMREALLQLGEISTIMAAF